MIPSPKHHFHQNSPTTSLLDVAMAGAAKYRSRRPVNPKDKLNAEGFVAAETLKLSEELQKVLVPLNLLEIRTRKAVLATYVKQAVAAIKICKGNTSVSQRFPTIEFLLLPAEIRNESYRLVCLPRNGLFK